MAEQICTSGVPHTYEPDHHFCCKMRHMRENGGLAVHYPYGGRQTFKGPTIKERQAKMIEECRSQGWEPRVKNPLYDNAPAVKAG